MATPAEQYLHASRGLVDAVERQLPAVRTAADWFARTILAGRMVHVFASGHSRIMVEEMWPRYGSFPGFNPIVELSLTFHNLVAIEMAEQFRSRGVRVVSIVSLRHSQQTTSNHASGKKLPDISDLTPDTGAPPGDAMVKIDGLETPVSPGSTIGGCLLINSIKAELAERLTRAGHPPKVLAAAAVVGAERAKELFESA